MKLSKNSRNYQITICNSNNPNHFNTNIINPNSINIHLYLNKSNLEHKYTNSYKSSYDIFKHVKIQNDTKTKNIIHKILTSPSPVLLTQPNPVIPDMRSFLIKNIHLNNALSSATNRDKHMSNESVFTNNKRFRLRNNYSDQTLFTNSSSDIKGNSYLNISSSTKKRQLPKLNYYTTSSQSQRYQNNKLNHKQNENHSNTNTQPNNNNKIKQIRLKSKGKPINIQQKRLRSSVNLSKDKKDFIKRTPKPLLLTFRTKKQIKLKNNIKRSDIFTFSTKLKIERFPLSIITEHCSKTLYTNPRTYDTSTIDFYLERIFDIPSFSIYGICQGNENNNSFLIASIAKNALTESLTNNLTYNVSFNPISDDILNALTLNDYEVIHLLFKGTENEIRGMLRLNKQKSISYSIGLVFVIGNEIIFVNYGYSVLINIIKHNSIKTKEFINSYSIFNKNDMIDKKLTIERKTYNNDMKFLIICNDILNKKELWMNILKIIVNEKVKIDDINYPEVLCTLNDKINVIYDYICKIYSNDHINFSMIILKF
jgi:hypothetical protein